MFTTEYGAASLVLKEIPYKEEAYITIRATQQPEELLAECVGFCRACGAERIFATGHDILEKYPLQTAVLEMRGQCQVDEEKVASLFPVTEQTVKSWRQLCNERMRVVDNSATLESRDEKDILSSGGAYFVHENGGVLGIGWIDKGELLVIAAAKKGAGERVMHTLFSMMPGAELTLQVAPTNERAIRLYERLGFIKTKEVSRWYRVFPDKK